MLTFASLWQLGNGEKFKFSTVGPEFIYHGNGSYSVDGSRKWYAAPHTTVIRRA